METTKSFDIPKSLFMEAYRRVKANAGGCGVDQQSLSDYEKHLKDNLYKLWNRMSSGSYFPPAVKAVPIPKKAGGERILGVPTVADRIAQMVVKLVLEPQIEPHFLENSYGYRPNKSALDAIAVTRERCWRYDWVLEFDIKGLFDNIPHDLLMKAVEKHTQCRWIVLHIGRWLKAPLQRADGETIERVQGVPQGGVISPLLSNLFLHYVFDIWMRKNHPTNRWCRYADDGLVHCKTEQQAQDLLKSLRQRFAECGLELHPDKTKIVYCKDGNRKCKYEETSFDFLGYTFRRRMCKVKRTQKIIVSFSPAVSKSAVKSMRKKTRKLRWRLRTDLSIEEIAKYYNPVLRGWLNYYGRFHRSALYPVWRHFNKTLVAWAMDKYKHLRKRKTRAGKLIQAIANRQPELFVHWQVGMKGAFT